MFSCLLWSIAYREGVTVAIVEAASITVITGIVLSRGFKSYDHISYKEGYLLVSLGWVVASVFGSLPFMMSGYLPSFADAFFETVSGFTTTGASVVADVESWPKSLMFWRCLTQWLGGMGIIALFIAIIAGIGNRANQLFKAEVPGPISDKISPRIRENARKLWLSYVLISVACAAVLLALGMNLFDSLCHTFATMATGGFSTKNNSIAYYANPLIHWAITFFMFIAGTNFTLHFLAFKQRKPLLYMRDPEFRLYLCITVIATLLVVFSLGVAGTLTGWEERSRAAAFQVVSILTTTGFATADYNIWPSLAGGVLFLMMFVGGCAGSTGGNIKPGRYLIIGYRILIELKKMVHPKAVLPLRFAGKHISDDLLSNVLQFFFLYIMFLALGTISMNAVGMDIFSALTAAAACIGNIGPGFGLVGPTQNFGFVSDLGKYVLSILMLVGRLEIYPILVLLLPEYWKD
jgi:trk system potassium uptake protein TrkH